MDQATQIPRTTVMIQSIHCQCIVQCQPCQRHSFSTTCEGSISIACGRRHAAYDCGVKLHDCSADPADAMQTWPGDGGLVLHVPHCDCFFHFSVCLAVGRIQARQYGFTIVNCGCRIDLRPCRLQATARSAQAESVGISNRRVPASGGPGGAHVLQSRGSTRDFPNIIDDEDLEGSHVVATSFETGSVADEQREPKVEPEVGQHSKKENGQSSSRSTQKRPARSPVDQNNDDDDEVIQSVAKRQERYQPGRITESQVPSPAPYCGGVSRLLSPAVSENVASGNLARLPNRSDKAGDHMMGRQNSPHIDYSQDNNIPQSRSMTDVSECHNPGPEAGPSTAAAHTTFLPTPSGKTPSRADSNLWIQGKPNGRPHSHHGSIPQTNEEADAHTQISHASNSRDVLARDGYNDETHSSSRQDTTLSSGSIQRPSQKPENGQADQHFYHLLSVEDLGTTAGPARWYSNPEYLVAETTSPEPLDMNFAGPPPSPELMDMTDGMNSFTKDNLEGHHAQWPATTSGNKMSREHLSYYAPYVSDIAESSDDATASQGSQYLPTAKLKPRRRKGGQQPQSSAINSSDHREIGGRKRKRSDGSPTGTPDRNTRGNIYARPLPRLVIHNIRRPFPETTDIYYHDSHSEGTCYETYGSCAPFPYLGSTKDLGVRFIARNPMQYQFAHRPVKEGVKNAKHCQGSNRRSKNLHDVRYYHTEGRWLDQGVAHLIQFASILVAVGVARFFWA